MSQIRSSVIIGTGPAGLTAAIYAARANLSPLVLAGSQHGGQLTTTTEVENFPGFSHPVMGPQLMKDMTDQAVRVGAEIVYEEVSKVDFSGPVKKLYTAGSSGEISARTVIITTGATAKTLGLCGEDQLMGHGVSTCATCDGFFYRGKNVVVVGGGDSAMEESLYLADLAQKVWLVHRRDEFRASHIMLQRAREHANIEFLVPWNVDKLHSNDGGLSGVLLVHSSSGKTKDMQIDGLFYAIGHSPNSAIFLPYVQVDDHGYIKVHDFVHTGTDGVYAAGDVADPHYKQAITAAGMGCQAAMSATRYLSAQG